MAFAWSCLGSVFGAVLFIIAVLFGSSWVCPVGIFVAVLLFLAMLSAKI
ncbi:hypothetical protein [Streptomyces sp. NPDC041003]